MTQVYIGFSIRSTDGTSVAMRDNLFYAADLIGLDTSLCSHRCKPEMDDIHGSDQEIFKSDIMKLLAAKCVILELSNPSHDVGFYAGYLFSDQPKLPMLGLISKSTEPKTKRVSALLAGCPAITIREYDPKRAREQLPQIIHDWLVAVGIFVPRPASGPIILLTGPPGAGKTTQGHMLSRHLGIPHISIGETLRALPLTHPLYNEFRTHLVNGTIVPAYVMKHVIRERLFIKDCRQGYILDGYPVDADNAKNLKELGVQPTLIIQIWADRQACIQRQLTRGEHSADKDIALATLRLDEYIAGVPSLTNKGDALGLADEFKTWFPGCKQIGFDTTNEARTANKVFNGILNLGNFAFPVPPITQEEWVSNQHGARIHFHINAADQQIVKDLAKKSGLPCKVYPINTLITTGSNQLTDLDYSGTYAKMPNFARNIYPNDNAAFATGILTEETIPQYLEFLDELSRVSEDERDRASIMTAVEEYIWIQKQFYNQSGNRDGIETRDYSAGWHGWSSLSRDTRNKLENSKSLKRVEYDCYEIHHSLDIPKLSVSRDALKEWLNGYLQKIGNIGGIFILEKPSVWAVRTNEFYKGNYMACKETALAQQRQIECPWLIRELETSIELVHGIWTNPH
jgi:adenylate kinase